ncbi:MAG: tetratricopeptide repeat protein [Elusimicrobiota bacterium]|nr:tetratricopeptide repeat protein [Elusimicrobiota bacterium]
MRRGLAALVIAVGLADGAGAGALERARRAELDASLAALEAGEQDRAIPVLARLAGKGDAEALYHLGMANLEGDGVPEDREAALGHLSAAAKAGFAPAQFELAKALLDADETEARKAEGYKLAAALAEAGHRPAYCLTAGAHVTGQGAPQDVERGHALAQRAIDLPACRNVVAAALFTGGGKIRRNQTLAYEEWLATAKLGDEDGSASVGLMLMEGLGVKADKSEGARWLRLAAGQGNAYAANYLAHHAATVAAGASVDAEVRRVRRERRRKRREFWAGAIEAVAVAMPVVIEAAQHYADEQERALEKLKAQNALRLESHQAAQARPAPASAPVASRKAVARAPASAPMTPRTAVPHSEAPRAEPPPSKPAEQMLSWPEAVVVCPRPQSKDILFGASNCQGPAGSMFVDRVSGDINMKEIDRACRSSAREIGWIDDKRVFGCGYGINPSKASSAEHYDQAERHGVVVPGRRSYRCPARQSKPCRTPA